MFVAWQAFRTLSISWSRFCLVIQFFCFFERNLLDPSSTAWKLRLTQVNQHTTWSHSCTQNCQETGCPCVFCWGPFSVDEACGYCMLMVSGYGWKGRGDSVTLTTYPNKSVGLNTCFWITFATIWCLWVWAWKASFAACAQDLWGILRAQTCLLWL